MYSTTNIQNKNLNFLGDNLFSDYMDILAKDNTLEIIVN